MTEQRFTFDAIARLYDRQRPGYPDALFEDLFELGDLQEQTRILEIGCGTGQATRALARRGHPMLCLEPGPALAELARENLREHRRVEVRCQTFEDWPLERVSFGLAVSAQAFHWLDPAQRFEKVAAALRPGGSLAVIGNAAVDEPSPLREAIQATYLAHAPELAGPPVTHWYAAGGPLPELFAASGLFEPVEVRCHPWSRRLCTDGYLELMRTHSNHNMLPESQRERLLGALAETIADHGGAVEERYDAYLYVARVR